MGIALMVIGGILAVVGWIQGVMAGFKKDTVWGVLNLLFSPITPAIMSLQGEMSWHPVLLMIIGGILVIVGQLTFTAEMLGGILGS
jgi:hypothetical protein